MTTMLKGTCFVIASMMLMMGQARAAEDFAADCETAAKAAGGPGGARICGCLAKGLEQGGKAEEVLAVVRAPRGEKRGPLQAASDESRRVVMGCARRARDQRAG